MKRVSSHVSLASEAEINLDLSRLIIDRPQRFTLERKRSFDEQSWSELSHSHSHRNNDGFDSVLQSPAFPSGGFDSPFSIGTHFGGGGPHPLVNEAWEALRKSVVYFREQPVGTIAAVDHASEEVLNYDQVFVRDFVPSALAFLMNNETDIVKNFLLKTLHLQSSEKMVDRFKLGAGAMPASFKVDRNKNRNTETLVADFGESAIGRVAPVDSGFWWIILLRAYTKYTGDVSLSESPDCQKCMRLILNLCLSEGFDTFPTLLCTDGCSMIDRRMNYYISAEVAMGLAGPACSSVIKEHPCLLNNT
ncbi:unnamed protein product [Miscanthus lutarioriparius]|uniref:Alkaline/neutral invertase n=1 Tax=Miscanthus lutarioriparius TaxID=422564 RepID=A0A811QCT5_9POAL|nr:unnamed protein product [Miscanthus lutarioriparius]